MLIRPVRLEDAKELVAIYAPYVTETAITFETEVPTVAEFESRIASITEKFPYLVAEVDGKVQGYAYAHTYYDRRAYDWTVELSIYLVQSKRQNGLGTALYDALEAQLEAAGYRNFLACISLPNDASIAFHTKRGYKEVGHFKEIGYKFNEWRDIVWMQKSLDKPTKPTPLYKD